MLNQMISKFSCFVALDDADKQAIRECFKATRDLRPHQDIVTSGQKKKHMFVIERGCAFRFKVMATGHRQIISFLFPGDFSDPHSVQTAVLDHTIQTACDTVIAEVDHEMLLALVVTHPRIATAMWCTQMQEKAMLRERIVTIGRRDSYARTAHFICEVYLRLKMVGEVNDNDEFVFPLTQVQLGDSLGITVVHTNRTLMRLRDDHLIQLHGRVLRILDFEGLRKVADFDHRYLFYEGVVQPPPPQR